MKRSQTLATSTVQCTTLLITNGTASSLHLLFENDVQNGVRAKRMGLSPHKGLCDTSLQYLGENPVGLTKLLMGVRGQKWFKMKIKKKLTIVGIYVGGLISLSSTVIFLFTIDISG